MGFEDKVRYKKEELIECRRNCIKKNFMICTAYQIVLSLWNKGEKDGGAVAITVGTEVMTGFSDFSLNKEIGWKIQNQMGE